jgi:hypothetical protein
MAENVPTFQKKRLTQVQAAYRTPNCQDQIRNISRHILIKTLSTENKERRCPGG